jgi:hypothetical protein
VNERVKRAKFEIFFRAHFFFFFFFFFLILHGPVFFFWSLIPIALYCAETILKTM